MKKTNDILNQEDIEIIKDVISDSMNDLKDTILIAINVILAKRFEKPKIEAAMKLAEQLIDIS